MKTQTKLALVVTLLVLTLTMSSFTILPTASAHDPAWQIPTYAYISASPDPVGVGQTVFLVFWLDKVPPTAGGIGGDRWKGFTIDVTAPNGQTKKLGPFMSDATSAAWSLFIPDQVGTYSFVFKFPGQTASLYHPISGIPGPRAMFGGGYQGQEYVGDYYQPSSASTTLTVQDKSVISPPTYPLPTSYWTRPIEGQNTPWSSIASNYLGAYAILDKVQPEGSAPGSAHVMWTKPYQDGGIVGGNYWPVPSAAYYTGLSYEGKFNNPIIMYGRLYYDSSLGNGATSGPYTCVDLATGQTLWTNNDISPTFGMLYLYESFNQHGVIGDGYLVQTSGSTWRIFDARTGLALFNITGAPSVGGGFFGGYGAASMGPSGEIVSYSFDNTNHWLAQWNSSAGPNTPLVATPGNATESFQYRPSGSEDMSKAYDWNVTLATLPSGSSILRTIPGDMILFYTSPAIGFFGWGTNPFSITAISLKPYSRGYILWQKFYQPPAGNLSRSMGPVDPITRVFTMVDKETMQWSGFDLDSGEQLWGPVGDFRSFQYYGQVSNPPAPGHIAYGNLYVAGYGGELHCFDAKTGNLKWVYNNTYSGDQTPWGLYPLFITSIADGKVYLYSSEHSPNVPLYKGSQVRAVDALTGQELWKIDSWYAIGSFGQSPAPVADGKIVYLNVYDMQLYCLGKGPSATTVEAPLAGVTQGQSIIIQGKVTDESVGARKLIADGKFSSTPAMSDASQGEWMAHLYMQKPIPANVTGVDVSIDAIDSTGAVTHLATVKSDASGLYSYAWTPQKSGQFTILATFEGSNSYYASYDETAVSINAAPAASPSAPATSTPPITPPPTQTVSPSPSPSQPPPPTETPNTALYVGITSVVIIAVIAAVATLLRRRK